MDSALRGSAWALKWRDTPLIRSKHWQGWTSVLAGRAICKFTVGLVSVSTAYQRAPSPFSIRARDANNDRGRAERLHPELPYTEAEIVWAVREEMARGCDIPSNTCWPMTADPLAGRGLQIAVLDQEDQADPQPSSRASLLLRPPGRQRNAHPGFRQRA
jgi:hypothetical protein